MDAINVIVTGGTPEVRLLIASILEQGLLTHNLTEIENRFVTPKGRSLKATEVKPALNLIQRDNPDLTQTDIIIRGAKD